MKLNLTGQVTIDAAAADGTPRRTISGIAAPYGVEATVADGTRIRIEKGALPIEGKAPKLFMYHDATQPVGIVTERVDTDEGMMFAARIANTPAGNEALTLAMEGVLDSVSVGINPTQFAYEGDVLVIKAAEWTELSLVPIPAFAGASITDIAASIHHEPEQTEHTDLQEPQKETPEMSEQVEAPQTIEASTVTQTVFAQPRAPFKMPSIGEYMSKIMAGGVEAQQFLANLKAAAPDVTTADTPGILPEPILGPVYNNFLPNYRPLVSAMGTKAMPGGGKIFRRPSVTTHTTIGISNGENVALDDGTFVVSDNPVTKQVFGGFVQLSEEDQEWTDPAVLNLIVDDMARLYAQQTDVYACSEFEAGVTQTATLTSATDPAAWIEFVYEAASTILLGSNGNLPNVIIMDPLYFQNLGALVDKDDRPLFPQIGPMNASGTLSPDNFGGTAFGLQIVVDKNLVLPGGNNLYVGRSDGFEIYEQPKGAISVEAADGSLSRFIKFRGYFATLMIDATKFVVRA
jgi:HK97 family phage prohead protease